MSHAVERHSALPETSPTSPRARGIAAAARQILEEEGREALTMRRLGEAVGIRAPSLYKHFPDKAAVEIVLIEAGFAESAAAFKEALQKHGETLPAIAAAYRAFARQHPHLYRLMTEGPLPRDRLRPGAEAEAAAPLLQVIPDPDLARAAWAFAHGMTILELDGRFPPGADLDAAWTQGIAALETASRAQPAAVQTQPISSFVTRPTPGTGK
jgi:AcrR family transcriptional regulator